MFQSATKKVIQTTALMAALLVHTADSHADIIDANTSYLQNGTYTFYAFNDLVSYAFIGTYLDDARLEVGSIVGNQILDVRSFGSLNLAIHEYDRVGGQILGQVGSGTGFASQTLGNVRVDDARSVGVGALGEVTGGALEFTGSGTLNGSAFSTAALFTAAPAMVNPGDFGGYYDRALALASVFNFAFGNPGPGVLNSVDSWTKGNIILNGLNFATNGDIHSQYSRSSSSEVPEPMTVGLLGMGLLGGALRRRKNA